MPQHDLVQDHHEELPPEHKAQQFNYHSKIKYMSKEEKPSLKFKYSTAVKVQKDKPKKFLPHNEIINATFYEDQKFIQNTIVRSDSVEDKLNIMGIYLTQTFGKDGVFIKVSQFNHSCKPNAFSFAALPSLKLVALKNIKAGQEITCAKYDSQNCIYMLNKKRRQEELHKRFLVLCHCNHCDLGAF